MQARKEGRMAKGEGEGEGEGEAGRKGKRVMVVVKGAARRADARGKEPGDDGGADAAERLTVELARVRARFGVDPVLAREPLDEVWTSAPPAMEEDEAELVDAVADCLSAGLPLEAALACWDTGGPLYDAENQGEDDEDDEGDAALLQARDLAKPAAMMVTAGAPRPPATALVAQADQPGKRLLVR
jgi:hypothetical protein